MSRYFVDYEIEFVIITSDGLYEYRYYPELLEDLLCLVEVSESEFNELDSMGYVVFKGIREDYKI